MVAVQKGENTCAGCGKYPINPLSQSLSLTYKAIPYIMFRQEHPLGRKTMENNHIVP